MSFSIALSSLAKRARYAALKRFTCKPLVTPYQPDPPSYYCFHADPENDLLYLPIGAWKSYLKEADGFPNGEAKDFPKMNSKVKFTGQLLTAETDPKGRGRDQDVIAAEALRTLKKNGAVFISLYTGGGKTCLGIYLSITLKLKTLILCHFDIVRRQWPGEYATFSGNTVKIQMLRGKGCTLDPTADVYIVGIQKAALMTREDFLQIGTVIVDEAHIATVTAFTKVLLMIQPRYLIGLSATPDRADGLHSLITNYFGDLSDFIIRKEVKEFTVYKVQTPFKPEISYTMVRGKTVPNWNAIINSIEENELRWKLIADIVAEHPDEKIIILCNRNSLSTGVHDLLIERGENAVKLIGTTKKYDSSARVLVAGTRKGGTGLNDPDLTMLIMASDTKDVRQFEGRIRTTNNIIYDLVDYYKPFQSHYEEREDWYLQKGATIEVIGVEHIFTKKTKSPQRGVRSKRRMLDEVKK